MEPFLTLNGPSWPPRAPKSLPRALQDRFFTDFLTILAPKSVSQSLFFLLFSPPFGAPGHHDMAQKKRGTTSQPNTAQHYNIHHRAQNSTPHNTKPQTKQQRPSQPKCLRPRGSHPTYGPLLGGSWASLGRPCAKVGMDLPGQLAQRDGRSQHKRND